MISLLHRAAAHVCLLLGSACRSECTVCRYPLCATVRPNQHLFFKLFGAQPGRGFRQADVSARAVGESISLDGTAAFFLSLSFVHLPSGGAWDEWAGAQVGPAAPHNAWPQVEVGWSCPRGWWATACLCGFSVCMCVSCIIKWGRRRSLLLASAVALITQEKQP